MKNRQILLVEDDEDDQLIFLDALQEISSSVECKTVNNGLEAIVYLKSAPETPSLIFLDLNMPLMNGFEFLSLIKKDNRFREIPVIIFTTSDDPLDKKRTKELGADSFFTKIPDFKLMKSRLLGILKGDYSKLENAL
jgi:CheY-like chemotaxis protein